MRPILSKTWKARFAAAFQNETRCPQAYADRVAAAAAIEQRTEVSVLTVFWDDPEDAADFEVVMAQAEDKRLFGLSDSGFEREYPGTYEPIPTEVLRQLMDLMPLARYLRDGTPITARTDGHVPLSSVGVIPWEDGLLLGGVVVKEPGRTTVVPLTDEQAKAWYAEHPEALFTDAQPNGPNSRDWPDGGLEPGHLAAAKQPDLVMDMEHDGRVRCDCDLCKAPYVIVTDNGVVPAPALTSGAERMGEESKLPHGVFGRLQLVGDGTLRRDADAHLVAA